MSQGNKNKQSSTEKTDAKINSTPVTSVTSVTSVQNTLMLIDRLINFA